MCVYVCVCMSVCACVYVSVCVHVYVCAHVCVYVCKRACIEDKKGYASPRLSIVSFPDPIRLLLHRGMGMEPGNEAMQLIRRYGNGAWE